MGCVKKQTAPIELNIIPKPLQTKVLQGKFEINDRTIIAYESESLSKLADYLQSMIHQITGVNLEIRKTSINKEAIILKLIKNDDKLKNKDFYSLDVNNNKAVLSGITHRGIFLGTQTLRQLMPYKKKMPLEINRLQIKDQPKFAWRGMHMDFSRHFFSVEYVKKFIDLMALYKFNSLHMHLTDDQGWRLEIKKYPKLTKKGAWRVKSEHDKKCLALAKETGNNDFLLPEKYFKDINGKKMYGGFFTQEDIKEIIDYADKHFITILPEIDMPAHIKPVMDTYPKITCFGNKKWSWGTPVCVGNKFTFEFLEDVIKEVAMLFPNQYIHIGADEVIKDNWKRCKKCRAYMKKNGIEKVENLQSFFVKQMEKIINKYGKKMIGWDEIIEGGLSKTATLMYWRSWVKHAPLLAAKQGNYIVMSPTSHCYFDYKQDKKSLKKVYSFDPIPENFNKELNKYILGGQGNLWSEYIPTERRMDYMAIPRMQALSEALWLDPKDKNFEGFENRLQTHLLRLDRMGYYFRALDLEGVEDFNVFVDKMSINLVPPIKGFTIRYTSDGSNPNKDSKIPNNPIVVDATTIIKYKLFYPSGRESEIFKIHLEKQNYREPDYKRLEGFENGIQCEYKAGIFRNVNDMKKVDKSIVSLENDFDFPQKSKDKKPFGCVYTAYIKIDKQDIYNFYLNSDDGSTMNIGDKLVVDNDGAHAPREKQGQIALKKGIHKIIVKYTEQSAGGGGVLELYYKDSEGEKRKVPSDMLFLKK